MLNKEIQDLGESFKRLLANTDYQELQKFVSAEIQTLSTMLLQPKPPEKSIEQWAMDNSNSQGQLIGLALPDSHMESVIKQAAKLQEKEEKKVE